MKKRLLALILALIMMVSMCTVATATTTEEIVDPKSVAAYKLYELGLVLGTNASEGANPEFNLLGTLDRNQAIVMLVRLLGKESYAKTKEWETPFTDGAIWAKPYIGYAYCNGLTSGKSETTYGGHESVTSAQFLTFVLRALGYSDKNGEDFTWNNPFSLAKEVGILREDVSTDGGFFVRGDAFVVCFLALSAKLKGSEETLAGKLIREGAISEDVYNEIVSGETVTIIKTTFDNSFGRMQYCRIDGKSYDCYRSGFLLDDDLYEKDGVYYARFNPTLYISSATDVRVEGALVSLLALASGNNKISATDNPYLDGEINVDVRPYRTVGMTISEEMIYSSLTQYECVYSYNYRGKSLQLPEGDGYQQIVDGVEFYRPTEDLRHNRCAGIWHVNVNDFFTYFGINKTISVENIDGVNFLVIE